jgi:hypothetical protein
VTERLEALEVNVQRLAKIVESLMENVERLIDAVSRRSMGNGGEGLWKTWRKGQGK